MIIVKRYYQWKSKNLKSISIVNSGAQNIVNTVSALVVEVDMLVTGKKAVGKVKLKIS